MLAPRDSFFTRLKSVASPAREKRLRAIENGLKINKAPGYEAAGLNVFLTFSEVMLILMDHRDAPILVEVTR